MTTAIYDPVANVIVADHRYTWADGCYTLATKFETLGEGFTFVMSGPTGNLPCAALVLASLDAMAQVVDQKITADTMTVLQVKSPGSFELLGYCDRHGVIYASADAEESISISVNPPYPVAIGSGAAAARTTLAEGWSAAMKIATRADRASFCASETPDIFDVQKAEFTRRLSLASPVKKGSTRHAQ